MTTHRPALRRVTGDACAAVASPESFVEWLLRARPGQRMAYARALWLPRASEGCVITLVRDAFDQGEVRLCQSRLPAPPEGPGGFEYLVERRQKRLRPAGQFKPRGRP